ncbi:hypothetical protein SAMN00790413_06587 [Deinococcus hopiensis KR-140]|uniref:Uncharacterized protein n=1 Tax=Deinococcus hopiensis KR-140 TaxID=695939 RepID=A0A1W1UBW4_9DEIO|nr:hypothetical protein SAMN00790413_06587 [Deinococcus hopiensis KR-140]
MIGPFRNGPTACTAGTSTCGYAVKAFRQSNALGLGDLAIRIRNEALSSQGVAALLHFSGEHHNPGAYSPFTIPALGGGGAGWRTYELAVDGPGEENH